MLLFIVHVSHLWCVVVEQSGSVSSEQVVVKVCRKLLLHRRHDENKLSILLVAASEQFCDNEGRDHCGG